MGASGTSARDDMKHQGRHAVSITLFTKILRSPNGLRTRLAPGLVHRVIRRLTREPLLHFAVLGAALFAAFTIFRPASSDSSAIVVSNDRIAAIVAQFRGTWQRPPSREELDALIESYVREEVLYREGLALGLDRDDLIVRNRVKQKMEVLSEDALAAEPSDADLQTYLDQHREVFATPAALSFEQVYFDPDRHGEQLERDVRQSLAALREGRAAATCGDRTLLPPRMDRVLPVDVTGAFGDAFEQAVRGVAAGEWSGPIRSSFGYHLVRVAWRGEPVVPTLADVHDLVVREWTRAHTVAAREQLYRSLRKRYTVTIAPPRIAARGGGQP